MRNSRTCKGKIALNKCDTHGNSVSVECRICSFIGIFFLNKKSDIKCIVRKSAYAPVEDTKDDEVLNISTKIMGSFALD